MRTQKAIEDLITGIIISTKSEDNPDRAAAKRIIKVLLQEKNLNVPPIKNTKKKLTP